MPFAKVPLTAEGSSSVVQVPLLYRKPFAFPELSM